MAGSVTGFQIGLETTNTQISHALESAWGSLPSTTFQADRFISESLKHNKTRTRPGEIRGDRQAAPALTTQEQANGSIVFPVYYSSSGHATPFDDFIGCLFGADWAAVTNIVGVSGDVVGTWSSGPKTFVLSTATGGKFSALSGAVGNIVKLKGFTNTVNNGFYRVSVYTSATNVTLVPQGFTPVTETPSGANFNLYYSGLKNSTLQKTLYIQKRLDPTGTKWFRYPGCYPTRGQFQLNVGQFAQTTFDLTAQQELKGTTDASTGGITTAPTTNTFDPIGGFQGVYFNDALLTTAVDQLSFDWNNEGAGGQYAIGNSFAQGMLGGTFTSSAKVRLFFSSFLYYDLFKSETPGIFSIRTGDAAGNQYAFTATNTQLIFDSGVPVPGANQSLMADVSCEFTVDPVTGATLAVDRIPATA